MTNGRRVVSSRDYWPGLLVAFLVLFSAAAVGQETVAVRAWPHDGFGRIVFDWAGPVEFETSLDGARLEVRFDRPFASDYRPVQKHLGGYIDSVVVGEDGRSVIFSLTGAHRLRKSRLENAVVIDLVEGSGDATVNANASASSAAGTLGVRTGVHPGYTRIVFDWTRDVEFTVAKSGNVATITFGAEATPDLARLNARPPNGVRSASARVEGGRLIVDVAILANTRLRHFRSGTKVVLDVIADNSPEAEAESHVAEAESRVAARDPPSAAPVAAESPAPASDSGGEALGESTAAGKAPTSLLPPELVAEGRRDGGEDVASGDAARDSGGLAVSYGGDGGRVQVAFAWSRPVAAAVFERAGHLWVVFDDPTRAKIDPIPASLADVLFMAEQLGDTSATALRFKLAQGMRPAVSRRDETWQLDFTATPPPLARPIPIRADNSAALVLIAAAAEKVLGIRDPEVGDTLSVIPLRELGQGIAGHHGYAQFDVLPSAQGVAISALADGVDVRLAREGIVITSRDGLLLSDSPGPANGAAATARDEAPIGEAPDPDIAAASEELGDDPAATAAARAETPELARRLFDYVEWRRLELGGFADARRELQLAIALAVPGGRTGPRWDLARFFFANGHLEEALAVMDVMAELDPAVAGDAGYRAVRGATLVRLGRMEAAASMLFGTDLDGSPEVALWRAAVLAEAGEWERVHQETVFGAFTYDSVPAELRARFRLLAGRAANALADYEVANEELNAALEDAGAVGLRSEINLARADMAIGLGEIDIAVGIYDEVIGDGYRPIVAEARRARAELLLAEGRIEPAEAIDDLERLRFVWRGGAFERDVLRRLSELYRQTGDHRNGLLTLRELTTAFVDEPAAEQAVDDMNSAFRDLFLGGSADDMSPVQALALFNDFRELTPAGAEGDAMLRRLADRFVAIDLFDRAAELLQHQVEFRLSGAEKSRVAARLAVVHLLNGQPAQALETLAQSVWKPLPDEVVRERRLLEAKALADLGRSDEALSRIKADKSRDAAIIRADIYWRQDRWSDAAESLDQILGERWLDPAPLDDIERYQVLRIAVALALAGQAADIAYLRERYGATMAETPLYPAFRVVTEDIDVAGTPFREAAKAVATLGNLDAFMAPYRERLPDGEEVGAIN